MGANAFNKQYEDIYKPFYAQNYYAWQRADDPNFKPLSWDNVTGNAKRISQKSFDVNDFYNNPFYNTTRNMYRRPIQDQQEADNKELMNQLNARNQTGSSYDAYQNYLQNKRYDTLYANAEDQSRLASANAYQQMFQNELAGEEMNQNAMNLYLGGQQAAGNFKNGILGSLSGLVSSGLGPAASYDSAVMNAQTQKKAAQMNALGGIANIFGQVGSAFAKGGMGA